MVHDNIFPGHLSARIAKMAGAAGLVLLAVAVALGGAAGDHGQHFWHSYLHNLTYFLSLSLGALFFVILQFLTRAGWSVSIRRIAELLAACLPMLVLLAVPIVIAMFSGSAVLYPWVDHALMDADHALHNKAVYLNVTFFTVRFAIYALIWTGLARFFLKRSTAQDVSGDPRLTIAMQRFAAPGMLLFALSVSFFAFDWLMSLDPHWYSTILGVYFFAGSTLGFVALTILLATRLQERGYLKNVITTEHYHDLGKLLFGFVFFWGYIAFSQYMLMWYANIPEETQWYLRRQTGSWIGISIALLVGHLLIPFPGLISRHIKRNNATLVFWAAWLLVAHWLDLYWLIAPQFSAGVVPFNLIDVACFLGLGSVYAATLAYVAGGRQLMPTQDPRLEEALAFENA